MSVGATLWRGLRTSERSDQRRIAANPVSLRVSSPSGSVNRECEPASFDTGVMTNQRVTSPRPFVARFRTGEPQRPFRIEYRLDDAMGARFGRPLPADVVNIDLVAEVVPGVLDEEVWTTITQAEAIEYLTQLAPAELQRMNRRRERHRDRKVR